MSFYVVSFPELSDADQQWIESVRQRFDRLTYDPVPPHVTLVFGLQGINDPQLSANVRDVVAGWQPMVMTMRCVLPYQDVLSDSMYLFLVPDEGNSDIIRLHDALYTGVLADQLRLDVPFIPHITIGYTLDAAYCKHAADVINAEQREIRGLIRTVNFLEVHEDGIRIVERFPLRGSGI